MTIREIYIAARNTRGADADDQYTEPPGRELNLAVIGTDAHLSVVETDEAGNRQPASRDVVVPARSLLRALHAAIDDENPEDHHGPAAR